MDITWVLFAYPAVGVTMIYPFAKYRSVVGNQEPGWAAFEGWAMSLVWPATLFVAGVGWKLKREEIRQERDERRQMTLERARELVADDEARQRREHQARNERLRKQWTALSGLEVGLDKPDPWEARQRRSIRHIWESVAEIEDDLDRNRRR